MACTLSRIRCSTPPRSKAVRFCGPEAGDSDRHQLSIGRCGSLGRDERPPGPAFGPSGRISRPGVRQARDVSRPQRRGVPRHHASPAVGPRGRTVCVPRRDRGGPAMRRECPAGPGPAASVSVCCTGSPTPPAEAVSTSGRPRHHHRAEEPCSESTIEAKGPTTPTPSRGEGDREGPAARTVRRR
jgi:hypothetical protein